MPLGFFGIEAEVTRKDREKGKTFQSLYENQEKELQNTANNKDISDKEPTNSSAISILIIGQNKQIILDYLCGLKQNMDKVFMDSELSYYTKDPCTIFEIVRTKKELEKCFLENMDAEWPKDSGEMKNANPEYYAFSISLSGWQQDSLDLKFCCATPDSDYVSLVEEASTVWILAKAIEEEGKETLYEKAVKQILYLLEKYPDKTVMMILSQFEHMECFYGDDASSMLSSKLCDRLYKNCCYTFAECLKTGKHNIMMCQIQLYGGLRYLYSRENGESVFGIGKDNCCFGYVPVGCHVPLFYFLIEEAGESNTFFKSLTGRQIYQKLQKSFSPYLVSKQWKPRKMTKEELI